MNLKEENILLKQKLDHAQEWMHREVFAQSSQSQRDIIYEKISSFFPPETLMNFPENAIDSLISSEIIFQNQSSYNFVDGSSIIL